MKTLPRLLVLASLILPLGAFAAGAIAVDDEEGENDPGYGIVTGSSSRDAAGAAALAECRKQGNKNCKVAVRFDTCGAYASSKKNSGIGFGGTIGLARAKALEDCGANACKIIVSDCE
ncbi:MAG: DUF4189 domain-containing protein [Burkholderiales bacterium]|nr:DUF4189 domain-containing protein [Burkholderiales bacterium]